MWTFPAARHFFLLVIFNSETSIQTILTSLSLYHQYISIILFFEPRTVLQY